jgi:Resolvase, N terminal domain
MKHASAGRMTEGQRIGYVRVSTVAQTLDQQHEALDKAGVAKTFSDTMSGARDDRPGLAALMEYVREGDTVVVWKLDRLGRNTLHILETVKALADRGVTLVSTPDGIDSSTAAGRMMIGVLGSLAEYEPELVGAHRPQTSDVSGQRHQIRAAEESRGPESHHDGEADEERRSHCARYSQVPRGQPRHPLPVPG